MGEAGRCVLIKSGTHWDSNDSEYAQKSLQLRYFILAYPAIYKCQTPHSHQWSLFHSVTSLPSARIAWGSARSHHLSLVRKRRAPPGLDIQGSALEDSSGHRSGPLFTAFSGALSSCRLPPLAGRAHDPSGEAMRGLVRPHMSQAKHQLSLLPRSRSVGL